MENENQEQKTGMQTTLSKEQLIDAKEQLELYKQYVALALKITNTHDWVDMDGKPYLNEGGSSKLAKVFGISTKETVIQKEICRDENDKLYYVYTVQMIMYSSKNPENCQSVVGACSSRDKLFGTENGNFKDISLINETNIKKKAETNCFGRGVKRMLGIQNLTWEDLNHAGIKKETTSKVNYNNNAISDDDKKKRSELGNMILEMSSGDKIEAKAYLKSITAFTGKDGKEVSGVESVTYLREKRLNIAHSKVKKIYLDWQKSLNNAGKEGVK
jgi:hypothetical protein